MQGASGDATTYAVSCRVRDIGVDEDTALDLMLQHWNDRCSPPWDGAELQRKVRNSYAYAKDAPGNASPEAVFTKIERPAPVKRRYTLARDIKPVLDRPALVKNFIGPAGLSLWFGPSNVGKSFVLLDLALRLTAGVEWFKNSTQRASALYLAAEGGVEIQNRVEAAIRHHGWARDLPFAVVTEPMNLSGLGGTDPAAVVDMVADLEKDAGLPVGLIVIDTLAAVAGGMDENSAQDMMNFTKVLLKMRDKTRAHVATVHHMGKDKAKGARGHSSLFAAMDSVFAIDDGEITTEKQRDMLKSGPVNFHMHHVPIHGEVGSMVIQPGRRTEPDISGMLKKPALKRAYQALREAIDEEGGAVSKAVWTEHLNAENEEAGRKAIERAIPKLAAFVLEIDGKFLLRGALP